MLKKIIVSSLLVLCGLAAWSQDTLSGSYYKLHLTKKNYVINENEVISVTDSLVVDAGVTIRLGNNATLVSLGAIAMNGLPNNRIRITSKKNQTGKGMLIAAQSNFELHFKMVTFDSLVMPIGFNDNWFRTEIDINNCQFINNEGTTAVIQFLNPTTPLSDAAPITTLRLTKNLFAGNIAPIRFEDMQTDYFKIEVVANTFIGNRISGYSPPNFTGMMLFGRLDKMQSRFKAVIKGNSFVNNYLRDIEADTLIQLAHMGIYGNSDSLVVPSNYWGDLDEKVIRTHIYDNSSNFNAPRLILDSIQPGPYDTLPPHVYDLANTSTSSRTATGKPRNVFVSGKWMQVQDTATTLTYNYNLRQGLRSFRMTANRQVLITNMSLHFIYMKDSVTIADSTFPNTAFRREIQAGNNIVVTFNGGLVTDSMFKTKPGYLAVRGLGGTNGEFVPDVLIGYQSFLKYSYSKKAQGAGRGGGAGAGAGANDGGSSKKIPPEIITPYKKKYEYGILAGNAIYYGTLSNRNLFANDYNSIFGFQFRYNKKKNLAFSLSLLSATLTGSDRRSGDTAKVNRGFSLKHPLQR